MIGAQITTTFDLSSHHAFEIRIAEESVCMSLAYRSSNGSAHAAHAAHATVRVLFGIL